MSTLPQRLLAEGLGTALLLACVVGSGVMGVALADGNDAVALLAHAGATAGMLYVLITVLGPISGAHFNPAVTLAMALRGELPLRDVSPFNALLARLQRRAAAIAHADAPGSAQRQRWLEFDEIGRLGRVALARAADDQCHRQHCGHHPTHSASSHHDTAGAGTESSFSCSSCRNGC